MAYDLYYFLKRRKISLEDWLRHNNINSIEEFNNSKSRIEVELGCAISGIMQDEVTEILSTKKEQEIDVSACQTNEAMVLDNNDAETTSNSNKRRKKEKSNQ